MTSKQFKLQLIQSSLIDLGYPHLSEQLTEDIQANGPPILGISKSTEGIASRSKSENETRGLEFIDWFYGELKLGKYTSILAYLNFATQFEETPMSIDSLPQDTKNFNDIDFLNLLNLHSSDKSIGLVCTLVINYLLKRAFFLESLVVLAFYDSDHYDETQLTGDISKYRLTPVTVQDLIALLTEDLCPLLDEIQNALKSINVNVIVGSLWKSNPELISDLTREKESRILLSLVMKSPLDINDLERVVMNPQVALADVSINQLNIPSTIRTIRGILLDNHIPTIFKLQGRNSNDRTPTFEIPANYLERLIENASAYQKQQCPYYLPSRMSSRRQTENFIAPIYTNISDRYKQNFPSSLITTLSSHSDEVWIAKFSPLGKYLVTGSLDGRLIIYDVLNKFEVLAILDSDNEGIKSRQKSSRAIIYCCWEPNEQYLVSCCLDTVVRVWSVKDIGKTNKRITRSMDYEQDNKAQGPFLKTSFTLGDNIRTWSCEFLPSTLATISKPQFIIGSPDKMLKAYDVDGQEVFDFYSDTEENGFYHDEKMSDNENKESNDKLDSTTDNDNKDGLSSLQNNFNRVNDLTITPDGNFLITANVDNQVYFYTIPDLLDPNSTTTRFATISLGGRLTSCSVSSNGKYLLLSIAPEELQIWDISTLKSSEKPILKKKLIGHRQDDYIVRSSFGYLTNDQEELAISGSVDGFVYIWKIETGQLVTRIKGHDALCNSVDWNKHFLPKKNGKDYGKLWCSVGDDKIVKIWGPYNWEND